MASTLRGGLRTVAFVLLPPAGAAAIIVLLLFLGVPPHTVFLPGFAAKAALQVAGIAAPNRVGVLATVGLWWAIIITVLLALRRRGTRTAGRL